MASDELIDCFADALIVLDAGGIVRVWSAGATAMFGHARADAEGRALLELLVPPATWEQERRHFALAFEQGSVTYEAVRVRKDGSTVEVDVSIRAIADADGGARLAISKKDVSHLRYLRQAAALEARFHGLFDAVPDAMVLVSDEGRVLLVNREAERVFGYPRDEMVGRTIEMLVPQRWRDAHPPLRQGYVTDPRTRPMGEGRDLWARRKDGSEFPAEISLARVELAEGTFTSAAIRDVTLRRAVEAKFRGLLEAAPDAHVIVDTDGRIVLVNAQAERMFGYTRDELIGGSVDVLVPPRDRERHQHHRRGYISEPRARSMGSDLELQAVRKNGTTFPVEISLSPITTEDGILVSSAIRDVSQRKDTETALKEAYKELESFSYSIAHDLRAPLRGMNGFAQILLAEYSEGLGPDALDCLQEIHNNAVRMSALIDALLSLSRVSRSELRRERVDLTAFARAAFARACAEDPTRVVAFSVADELVAFADPALARTLVENLVGNAWKFTGKRSSARIELGSREIDGAQTFFVRDDGAGFDMSYAAKLFTPFQRLHGAGEFAGTGIGLATAHRIVSRHGGRISIEAAPDRGATVYFTLPSDSGEH